MKTLFYLFLTILVLSSCNSVQVRTSPMPQEMSEESEVLGDPYIKSWGDKLPTIYSNIKYDSVLGITELGVERVKKWKNKDIVFLALSGGGAGGAYGAGVLNGWSKTGKRPQFTIVTGISTGALIAPFAFLGEEYDSELKKFYTTLSTDSLAKKRNTLKALKGDAMYSNDKLRDIINRSIDKEMMAKIAHEDSLGRVLLIGTTDMDALRPVIWDIGEIAQIGTDEALQLIQKVIYASTSIPLVFPPVVIETQGINGDTYQELHADGGVASQVFLMPAQINWAKIKEVLGINENPKLYIICNSKLYPEFKTIPSKTLVLAGRAIASLTMNQTIGDLYKMYIMSQENSFDYNLTSIPKTFTDTSATLFDLKYMNKLYNVGFNEGLRFEDWSKIPPYLK